MLGSGLINNQQHVGLQKLSALAAAMQSSLGPNKKYKFIRDDTSGESALACSCFRILQTLEASCAVGQLVYETVHAQQKVYHTGSGCLLFLAGAWSRACLECLHKGISITHIVAAMSDGMDICVDVCRKISVSIHDLNAMPMEKHSAVAGDLRLQRTLLTNTCEERIKLFPRTFASSEQRKIKLSRHFYESKPEFVPQVQEPDLTLLSYIAKSLSHGCDEMMELAVKAAKTLSENNQRDSDRSAFDITKVATCVIPGLAEHHACVVQGFVVLLSDQQASVAHRLKERSLKVALFKGDLSPTSRHLGFKRPAGFLEVKPPSGLSSSSKGDEWIEKVTKLLLKMKVDLILTTGHACESVIHRCFEHRMLVVEKVSLSALKTFANLTEAVPVTYVTQLSEHCVGSGIRAEIWRDLSSLERKSLTAVRIFTDATGTVSVVLTSCVHGKLQSLEDRFWACAHRLHQALKDGAVLPGAGATELLCVHHLQKQAECEREDTYTGVILQLMAEGFMNYVTTVMFNSGKFSKVQARTVVSQQLQNLNKHQDVAAKFSQLFLENESEVPETTEAEKHEAVKIFDNLSVKQEAWRKALDLVLLVLQSDAEIITGAGLKPEDGLMLL